MLMYNIGQKWGKEDAKFFRRWFLTDWKSLAVKEFINSCNWQGLLPQVSSKSINQFRESLTSWQSLSTYKFFTLNNWDGQTN